MRSWLGVIGIGVGLALVLGGCAAPAGSGGGPTMPGTASGTGSNPAVGATPITIRIGTLQTDDILPLWAAADDGTAAAAGLNLDIQTFASAQDQITAVTAGQIDAIMTDMVVPVQLSAAGTPMRAVTRLQGAPAGIVAGADAGITSLADLAGVAAGCASPTIMEYIYDKALTDAGVPADQIKTEEIKKLPVRLQMLQSGNIAAAVLPWTLYSLAVQQGAVPLLGVDQAGPYSSTVLAFRDAWLTSTPDLADIVARLLGVWDAAVAKIDADPNSYQRLLADKAQLPAPLDTTYQVRQYPTHALPDQTQFESVVAWMLAKGYISSSIAYADLVWTGA